MACFDESLIEMVRERPYIYDKSNKSYKNEEMKRQAWTVIAEALSVMWDTHFTAQDVQKRWSTLRDLFGRERRKLEQRSGSGATHFKEWDLYKSMMFLMPHVQHRRTTSSFKRTPSTLPASCILSASTRENESRTTLTSSAVWSGDETLLVPLDVGEDEGHDVVELEDSLSSPGSTCIMSPPPPVTPCTSAMKRPLSAPPPDEFARKKKASGDALGEKFQEANAMLASAATSFQATLKNMQNSRSVPQEKDEHSIYGEMIKERLKRVPDSEVTTCLIEVLGVIKKCGEEGLNEALFV